MKKIFICILSFIVFLAAGCSTNNDKDENVNKPGITTEDEGSEKKSYTINVYDIDDELLETKHIESSNKTLWEDLTTNFSVSYTESLYGPYIVSINGSVVDPNYFMAIYENGSSSQTGITGIKVDSGDVFDFKVECFNTVEFNGAFDSYDVLVDKAIYKYIKAYQKEYLSSQTTYKSSSYWDFMSISMLKENGYISNYNFDLKNEFIESLNDVDYSSLNANLFKYYYINKALGNDLTKFKTEYQELLNNSQKYSEYSTPFYLGVAIDLGLNDNEIVNSAKNSTPASTSWGYDGYCWQMASNALVKTIENSLVEAIPTEFSNGVSQAIPLMVYSALNINPRKTNDRIKILFDTYYDKDLNLIKYNTNDTTTQMSTNQIYTSLIAYKISRDLNKSINVFA